MPYARTDDRVRIYYEAHGHGTPLVLAYGIGGNTDMWDTNTAALAARHRVILWEPRGHARSDSPEDPARYSFARWALDAVALLFPRLDSVTRSEWLLYGAPAPSAYAVALGGLVIYASLLIAAGLFDFHRRGA